MQNDQKIVVTGATGAIGRALIRLAVAAGYEVLAIVHRASRRADDLDSVERCRVLRLDQAEYADAMAAMTEQKIDTAGYSLFFHMAWIASFGADREDLDLQLDNVRASLEAVRLARALGCRSFVGIGSQAEYGRTEGILRPDTPAFPETGYGAAKLCAGHMTRLECEKLGLRHVWCRVLSVYGPYDRDQTLMATAIRQMLQGEDTAFTPCDQQWDYLYSEDAARAILLAAEKGESGQVYMIGSGEAHPLREYIRTVAAVTGYTKEIGFGKRPYNDKQVMHLQADVRALEALGFRRRVPFAEGVRKTAEWQKHRREEIGG